MISFLYTRYKIKFSYFYLFFLLLCGCKEKGKEESSFSNQLGTYNLDVKKTKLGHYSAEVETFKHLQILFKSDSTFSLNMKVPFMFDSVGKWKLGNNSPYNYNELFYSNFDYSKAGSGEHFFNLSDLDSTFLLNSTMPQLGKLPVYELYFKKQITK